MDLISSSLYIIVSRAMFYMIGFFRNCTRYGYFIIVFDYLMQRQDYYLFRVLKRCFVFSLIILSSSCRFHGNNNDNSHTLIPVTLLQGVTNNTNQCKRNLVSGKKLGFFNVA